MIGVGATATAIAGVPQDGGVSFAISNRGAGYLSIPSVTLSISPSEGITGVGSVTKMIGGINFCNLNANPGAQSIQQLDVVNPGRGYTEPPKVKFKKTSGRTGTGQVLHRSLEMVLLVSSPLLMEVEDTRLHQKLHLVTKHS